SIMNKKQAKGKVDKKSIINEKQVEEKVDKAIKELFDLHIFNNPSILKTTIEKIIIRIGFEGYDSLKKLINNDNLALNFRHSICNVK
ncbi:20826_t:CDS:1, partial [Gigaspora rosea]